MPQSDFGLPAGGGASVHQIIQALNALEGRRGREAYQKLVEAMGSMHPPVRKRAAEIMAAKGREAAEFLMNGFGDLGPDQKHWAMTTVAWILGDEALPWLVPIFSSPEAAADSSLRSSVIQAVGEVEGDAPVEFLMRALKDDSWLNRYTAAESLEAKGMAVVEHLKKGFSTGKGDTKYWSLQLLTRIYGGGATTLLTACMSNEDPDIRHLAIRALGDCDEDWAILLLIPSLGDSHWANRELSSRLLVGKGKQAVQPLLDRIDDERPYMTRNILQTLAKIGDERMLRPTAQLVSSAKGERAAEVREWAVEALSSLRTEGSARRLLDMAQEFQDLRGKVQEAFKGFGSHAARLLIKAASISGDPDFKRFAKGCVEVLGLPGAVRLVREADNLDDVKIDALLGAMKAVPHEKLEEMLRSNDVDVTKMLKSAQQAFDPEASAISRIAIAVSPEELAKYLPAKRKNPGQPSSYPVNIDEILVRAYKVNASDVHMKATLSPIFRVDGNLRQTDLPRMGRDDVWELLQPILTDESRAEFIRNKQLDTSYEVEGTCRFRVNIYYEATGYGAAIRLIPNNPPKIADLDLPTVMYKIVEKNQDGLVIISGATGSGKSTTLAAMIDHLNDITESHVVTVEDPIEFRHPNRKCLITQRELGAHCLSFTDALRAALREDPDIILVGEMRDRETVTLALHAAETGHLVLSTLHTGTAAESIERLISLFPGDQQVSFRTVLAQVLKAVVCQHLVPTVDGKRAVCCEVMVNSYAVSNLIRENKMNQIDQAMVSGRADGMTTRDDYLFSLVQRGKVSREVAMSYAHDVRILADKFANMPVRKG